MKPSKQKKKCASSRALLPRENVTKRGRTLDRNDDDSGMFTDSIVVYDIS